MTTDTLAATPPADTLAPTYPHGWRVVRLGEAFRFTKKPRDLRFEVYQAIPFIPMEYVPIGSPVFSAYQMKAADELTSGTYIEDGDLLVAKITPSFENGKQGIIEGLPLPFGYATTEVIPINDIPGVSDKRFLACYLLRSSVRSALASRMEGSTGRQRLSASTLANLEIMLPPLAEQRAIARILRAAQDAIAARRREVTLERERKAALMQRLFTHGVRGEPAKQTEIGEMPQSWQVMRLGDVLAQTQYGLSLRGESSGDHPILRMNNLVEGHVDITDLQYVTTDDATVRQFQLAQGDILFNRTNSYELVGKTALFDLSGTFLFASYLIRVVPLAEKLLPGFLSAYLNSVRTQQRLRMLASRGVSQSNISASKLTGFLIPLPSLDEQRAIADALAACDTHIAALEREIALHQELFRALLEELMRGRLPALGLVDGKEVTADR